LIFEWSLKNGNKKLEDFTKGSNFIAYWICPNGHSDYPQSIKSRTNGAGCQICGNHKAISLKRKNIANSDKNITVTHPYLIKEWSFEKNIKDPKNYTYGSTEVFYWNCINNEKHPPYPAAINNRTNQKSGCPICSSSKGELKIREFLQKNNIKFIQEYKFDDCRNILPLPFDFAIWIKDELITCEFGGEEHYRPIEYFGGVESFVLLQKRDEIKRKYCEDNNIKLIVISYKEIDEIDLILEKELKVLNLQRKEDVYFGKN
jgi:hypothetical protein